MEIYPNAKINLGLNIVEKRTDGFHNIETIFYPVLGLNDKIKLEEFKEFSLINKGFDIEIDYKSNLIYKAYSLLNNEYKLPNIKITLEKNIPFGAGLGGGSADAAFTLAAINNFFSLKISDKKLENYASKIGSDCAFFIKNKPVYAFGRGDKFKEIDLSLSGYNLVIVKPNLSVSTVKAYSGIKPKQPITSIIKEINKPISSWKENLHNDFEESIFNIIPILSQIKKDLYKKGAIYASMSGSGSAIYGIFENKIDLSDFNRFFVWQKLL